MLYIPETVKAANTPLPSTGIVVKMGEDLIKDLSCDACNGYAKDHTCGTIQEGSMVMFSRFAGTDFMVEEEQFRILDEKEIMCTLCGVDEVVPVVE